MPLKLLSPGGGSVLLQANTTSLDYTLTVPAVTANVVTTGDTGSVGANMLASSIKSYSAGVPNFGAVLTGYVNCPIGSAHNYLDIANCFTSSYNNYLVTFDMINASTTSSTGILAMAFESGGSPLGGGGGGLEFATGSFVSGSIFKMRYGLLNNSGSDGTHYNSFDYPELMGTFAGSQVAGNVRFNGYMFLNDVYSNSIKFGNTQGVMLNDGSSGVYFEDSAFRFTTAQAGRGLRMWLGANVATSGTVTATSYGKINVYGLLSQ